MKAENVAGGSVATACGGVASLRGVVGDGLEAMDEPIGRLEAPIPGNQGPHNGTHALLMNDVAEPRATIAERRTKPTRFEPSGVLNGFGAAQQLGAGLRRTRKEQIGMRIGVIPENMPTRGYLFD